MYNKGIITDRLNSKKGTHTIRNQLIEYDAQKDHLKDGIGTYIYKNQSKKINPSKFVNKKNDYNKIRYENKDYNVTQRVIIPDKNYTKIKPNKKKFFSQEKNLRYTSDGSYQSLIDRTPISFPIKGRKKINNSFECDHDLFLRKNIQDDNGVRIFGVERKNIRKNHNYESELPKFKFGRKHFYFKEEKTSLY